MELLMNVDIHSDLIAFEGHLRYERRLSIHTVTAYATDLRQLADYLEKTYGISEVTKIKMVHLRSWLSDLKMAGMKNRSLRRKTAAISTFFQYLLEQEVVKDNPVQRLLLPKLDKPLPQFLKEQQTNLLPRELATDASFEDFTQFLIIELLYQTGMRRAELIGLKERDVDTGRRQIQVLGKGNKTRIIPISPQLAQSLAAYRKNKKKLFGKALETVLVLKSGKPLYSGYVYRTVKKSLSDITTLSKKSPHILRHTFASQLLNNGADLMSIKDLLGHKSLAATQVYTHINIERLKEIYQKAHPKSGR